MGGKRRNAAHQEHKMVLLAPLGASRSPPRAPTRASPPARASRCCPTAPRSPSPAWPLAAPQRAVGAAARPQRRATPASAPLPTAYTSYEGESTFCCAVATFLPSTRATSSTTGPTEPMAPLRHSRLQQHVVRPRARSRGQHRPRGRRAGGSRPTRAGQDAVGVLEQHVVLLCAVGGGGHHAARRRRLLAARGVLGLVLRL